MDAKEFPIDESFEAKSSTDPFAADAESANVDETRAMASVPSTVGAEDENAKTIGRGDDTARGRKAVRVPGYELHREIGRGGMGVVYRARDVSLGRDVAVKILSERYPASGQDSRRFEEEARITGRLQHPGIPPVHQVGALPDGRPFLAMKLIEGRTLSEILATAEFERGKLIAVFEQLCQAVGYAHAHLVIHRDLKPQNIMVGAFGEVQVMDWGLAKVLTRDESNQAEPPGTHTLRPIQMVVNNSGAATETGAILGTPAFISPEQARGETERIDERTDVFGLGGVLCAVLTGKPPYSGKDSESLISQAASGELSESFARLESCGAEPDLIALAKRCLAFEASRRPANAGEVAAAVAELRAAAETRARDAELERVRAEGERRAVELKAAEAQKRRNVLLALAGSVMLLVVLGGTFAWWADHESASRRAQKAEFDAREARAAAEMAAKAEQTEIGVRSALDLAAQLRTQYRFKEAAGALQQAATLAASDAPGLVAEVQQAQRDLEFVVDLDAIQMQHATFVRNASGGLQIDHAFVAPAYRAAFAKRGYELPAANMTELSNRVRVSSIKEELVAALDDWGMNERDVPTYYAILELARLSDPGEWTNRFRHNAVRVDSVEYTKLVKDAEKENLPPSVVVSLASAMTAWHLDTASLLSMEQVKHPTHFGLAFALGQSLVNVDPARAAGAYRAALALRPDAAAVYNNLALVLIKENQFDAAVSACRAGLRIDPQLGKLHYSLGLALITKREYAAAVRSLLEAERIAPDQESLTFAIALACQESGDIDGAIAAFERGLARKPQDAKLHNDFGNFLHRHNRIERAIAQFKRTIELDGSSAVPYYNLGMILYRKGDLAGGLTAFDSAIKIEPEEFEYHFRRGVVLAKMGNAEEAMAAYRTALKFNPAAPEIHNNLGAILLKRREIEPAIAELREATRLNPNYALAHWNLSGALALKGDLLGAAKSLQEASRLDPKATSKEGVATDDDKPAGSVPATK